MKKKLFLFLTGVSICISAAMGQKELLGNGNMNYWQEKGSVIDSLPTGYRASVTENCMEVFSRVEGRGGKSDYALNIKNQSKDKNRISTPKIKLSADVNYKLSFWVKGKGKLAWTRISERSSSIAKSTIISPEGEVLNYSDWTRIEYEFTVPKSGTYYVMFSFVASNKSTPSDITLDDISVVIK